MIAALFDVEGTLYTNQMGRGLLRYAREHGFRGAANRYYASVLPFYVLRKLKLVSDERLRRAAIGGLAGIVRGWTTDEAADGFDWIVNDYLLPTARTAVIARFENHRAQGHTVLLVSGMPAPCLERLGQAMGASGVIGTEIEVSAGRYTGRSLGRVMVGEDKGRATRAYVEQKGITVNWQDSFAYGDSVHDSALFDLVGHPVAVHPDAELRALAQRKQWEVIEQS
jgi:HAD superfamily hydrolase (TIGR01490 family)